MAKKPVKPIHLDFNETINALEEHKSRILGLVDDPRFRSFWTQMGGTLEHLDSARPEVEKWKIRK